MLMRSMALKVLNTPITLPRPMPTITPQLPGLLFTRTDLTDYQASLGRNMRLNEANHLSAE